MAFTIAEWERDHFYAQTAGDIDALPVTDEPVLTAPAPTEDEPCVLLEREYGGIRVELGWHPALGVTLYVKQGEAKPWVVGVPPEKALDAFEHPFCYLPVTS